MCSEIFIQEKFHIIIYAPNIHQGGGRVLLECLIKANKDQLSIICDQRLELNELSSSGEVRFFRVKPNLWGRLKGEILLRKLAGQNESILCFGNLPPVWKIKGDVSLFFQNSMLLEKYRLCFSQPLHVRLRLFGEKVWIKLGIKNVNRVLLQSRATARDFLEDFPNAQVQVAPFRNSLPATEYAKNREYDFVYVSSGDAHKNHLNLLTAWEILAKEGCFPHLALTVSLSGYPRIFDKVLKCKTLGCRIDNFEGLDYSEVITLYQRSKALIFPSYIESFGLPLLEARDLGLAILASEKDYVREVVNPDETFDPYSPNSIASAVKRFLGVKNDREASLLTPEEFIELLKQEVPSK